MEILIPGLILVALMVYASTRIKKTAAKAYAEERIDTPDFSIKKPEGFIQPTEDSGFAFAAYSKEFGEEDADKIRQASAEITVYDDMDLDAVRAIIVDRASKVRDEQRLAGGGLVIETEEMKKGLWLYCEYRVFDENGRTFVLAVKTLPMYKDAQQRNIDTFISSFEVK